MSRAPNPSPVHFSRSCPLPPSEHWLLWLIPVAVAEFLALRYVRFPFRDFAINFIIAIWPVYLCIWVRKIDPRSTALYWALAAFITGFLFSWLLWIVVIFEIREDLLNHYNQREPIGLRLNFFLTVLFSFAYFQYHLRRIAKAKKAYFAALDAPGHVLFN